VRSSGFNLGERHTVSVSVARASHPCIRLVARASRPCFHRRDGGATDGGATTGARTPCRRWGFSLLETTIAVGILGVGLIMVAAIFPVALSQHRDSVYQACATELTSKAEAILRGRLDPNQGDPGEELYSPADLLSVGLDSPWYLIHATNIWTGANGTASGANNWIDMYLYTDAINMFGGDGSDSPVLQALDILSDRYAPFSTNNTFSPFTDLELMSAPYRLVWTGFYRRLANGTVQYAVAICKQQRNQRFAAQNLVATVDGGFASEVDPASLRGMRLPVPWRVQVHRWQNTNILCNQSMDYTPAEDLGVLAPPGTKIMIQGYVYSDGLAPLVPAGRILTVSDVVDGIPSAVRILEDISDLPWDEPAALDDGNISFDVWVFPPPFMGSSESPLIDWKVLL